jgi:thiol-disulfide isomerase/thioredoxin
MKKLKLGLWAIIVIAAQACGSQEGTNINGTVENSDEVYVVKPSPQGMDTISVIDSRDGSFSFNTMDLDTADFFLLQTTDQYNLPVFVQPDEDIEVIITGSTPQDRKYTVEGSVESKRIMRVGEIMNSAREAIDTLNAQSQASSQEEMLQKKTELDAAFEQIVSNTRNDFKALIDEDPSSMANIFIFPQQLNRIQLIDIKEEAPYYDKVIAAIKERYPGNKHILNFENQVDQFRKQQEMQKRMQDISQNIQPGTPAPDIALPGLNGELKKLSDLKGKVVLVDFWAAWCKPCRMENPNVVRMYQEYSSKGFDVFSVSLDGLPNQPNARAAWEGAIQQDNLMWSNHVSDLQGWNSSVVGQYGFQGIPYTVLVGRDGNILATNLRGPGLEAKLKEVL